MTHPEDPRDHYAFTRTCGYGAAVLGGGGLVYVLGQLGMAGSLLTILGVLAICGVVTVLATTIGERMLQAIEAQPVVVYVHPERRHRKHPTDRDNGSAQTDIANMEDLRFLKQLDAKLRRDPRGN